METENVLQSKRYYWLKLPKSYFSHLEQKKMRKHEHGKDMQIVYLRMMLLGIDKGGYIYYQGVYDSLEEELAEEFDESVEIIRETLEYLKENNMISIDENSDCFVPESLNLTGSECSSAERMRKKRQRDKASQCNIGVTGSDTCVTSCDVEKELEKEKELENKIVCPEPEESAPNLSGILLPLNDKSFYDVPLEKIALWKDTYPAVDVEQELKRMTAWLDSNPTRKKTRRGIVRFINTWLSREQDRGGTRAGADQQRGAREGKGEYSREYREMYSKYLGKNPAGPEDPFQ